MKIDQDLRAAINAAAKAQPEHSWETEAKQIQESVAAFLKKNPALKRKSTDLLKQITDLSNKRTAVQKKLSDVLKPLGLYGSDGKIQANFRRNMDDEDAQKFIAAGGVLPPPSKRKWKAETVIARLAAAEPKQRDAILKEYGINWA